MQKYDNAIRYYNIRKYLETIGADVRLIRLLLIQDDRLFSEGIKAVLSKDPDIEVVGIAENASDVEQIQSLRPDIILFVIDACYKDIITATARLKERRPKVKIIFLIDEPEEELIFRAVNVGVDGFILSNLYPETCHRIIHEVNRGENVLSGPIAKMIIERLRHITKDKKTLLGIRLQNKGIELTARELEVAYLAMQGKTNHRIAQMLQISEGTVKNYMSEIYHTIGIHRRKEAIDFFRKSIL